MTKNTFVEWSRAFVLVWLVELIKWQDKTEEMLSYNMQSLPNQPNYVGGSNFLFKFVWSFTPAQTKTCTTVLLPFNFTSRCHRLWLRLNVDCLLSFGPLTLWRKTSWFGKTFRNITSTIFRHYCASTCAFAYQHDANRTTHILLGSMPPPLEGGS